MPTSIQLKQISERLHNFSKPQEFAELCECVKACQLCPRMKSSARILSQSSGSLEAKVMFIGEAPGRLGADATGIPFHGDTAGNNFESLLDFVGISREDIFVTNSVLCNPKDENGNNAPPNQDEISKCANFLKRQIDLINPGVVVTLGANALKSTAMIEAHNLTLRENVRTSNNWYGRYITPLYHPGQRAMIHRSYANQRSDYKFVADQLKQLGMKPRAIRGNTNDSIARIVRVVLNSKYELSYFALHKIMYLLEWVHMQEKGDRLTGAYFIRQKDGPYCTDLHLTKLKNAMPDLKVMKKGSKIFLRLQGEDLFTSHSAIPDIDPALIRYIENKLADLVDMTDAALKTRAYLTKPMKKILQEEKINSNNMYNVPILIGW
jgi:uracil-DNA glycosylase family 4